MSATLGYCGCGCGCCSAVQTRFVVGFMGGEEGVPAEFPSINTWVSGYDITSVPWGSVAFGQFSGGSPQINPNPDSVTIASIAAPNSNIYPFNCQNPSGFGWNSLNLAAPQGNTLAVPPFATGFANTGQSHDSLTGWVVVKSQILLPQLCAYYLILLKNGAQIASCMGMPDPTGIIDLPVPPKIGQNGVDGYLGSDVYSILPVLDVPGLGFGASGPLPQCCTPSSTSIPFYGCGLAS